ncbi:MAG: polysaccharide deacetylase family protein [Firmicutes bacterium]|nr:polysaccharide deacetylase family protein [Bacillota bacterium]
MRKYVLSNKFNILVLAAVVLASVFVFAGGVAEQPAVACLKPSKPAVNQTVETVHIPVIMYHSVKDKNKGKYIVGPATFEADILHIKQKGYTPIVVADLIAWQAGKKDLPPKPIMLTLDDGQKDNYFNAFPILKKHNTKAIISVIGKTIDENYLPANASAQGEKYQQASEQQTQKLKKRSGMAHLCYEQIKEMADSGFVEIQNHSYNMHSARPRLGMKKKHNESYECYKKALEADLMRLQTNLTQRAGVTPTAVIFPFGEITQKYTTRALKELGFKASFTCYNGINKLTKNSCLHELKRYNRPHGISTEAFFNKIFSQVEKSKAEKN